MQLLKIKKDQTLHRNLHIKQQNLYKTGALKEDSSCSTTATRRVTLVTNYVTIHDRGRENEIVFYDKRSVSVVICDTDIP
jgi:hypothetical protein